MHPLAERIAKQDIRALARAITYVESDHEEKLDLLQSIYPMTGGAHYIGITGAPGAGKSSLVNRLIDFLRKKDLLVGVAAVDPTSPFSGGAILGDRVRMSRHFTDPGVFIRSMGTRGSLGGLSRTTKEAVRLMDAFGFDVILVETVGVGQSELDIMKIADTTAVVLNPGSGDVVQVFKAGIMEIADLFIINKADLPGVGKLNGQINSLLDLIKQSKPWRPPIVRVTATKNEGLSELWDAVTSHRDFLRRTGDKEQLRLERFKNEVLEIVHYELMTRLSEQIESGEEWSRDRAAADPYTTAKAIIERRLPSMKNGVKGGMNDG
ncbi:LAO/AO transport system kinase [Scopulibacillus darangshiensis]|uniref:LAO/AO transport system kinase n=1 Tax=Scopulibacillus darangshiensis TaxID=442528 RepID=A0A4R2NN03_9BACL|nr:methylmalonyl Co-A mutase-associated GTPase MeaB [Scopulibacillus darangshiensis]TCP23010.1 LAO/AO transport system kinase [Scopulibacillus darangshiensis]